MLLVIENIKALAELDEKRVRIITQLQTYIKLACTLINNPVSRR